MNDNHTELFDDSITPSSPILPLISDEENRTQLIEWIDDHDSFEYVPFEGDLEAIEYDVCILDEEALYQYQSALDQVKEEADPVIVPSLLIAPEFDNIREEFEPGRPIDTIVPASVDEIANLPIKQAELEWRVRSLLRLRNQSLQIYTQGRRYQSLFESIRDAILVEDTDRKIVDCNQAFIDRFGYSRTEIEGKPTHVIYESKAEFEEMGEAIQGHFGDPKFTKTVSYETNTGEVFPGETNVFYLRDEEGDIQGFIGVIRDVSERQKRERELERNNKRLRLLFDEAPDGIVVHDIEGEIEDVNETLIENLGYTREELLSMSVFDIEVGAVEELARNEWESNDPGSIHKVEIEGTHQRKDGSTYPVEVWINRVASEFLEKDRFIVLTRDITDRKQRDRELRERKERLELASDTANVGVWEWDIQAETVLWEDSMETLVGLEPGTFEDTYNAFIDRVHPEDRSMVEETMEQALQRGTGFEQEFRLQHTSGEFLWILTRTRLFTDSEGTPERMLGVGIDISERIDQRQQLEVLDRVLRHNLRNDMTTIQGYAETIKADVDDVTEETEMIIETSRDLMETVEKEREIVKLLSERNERERFDLVDVCHRVVTDKREAYPEAVIEIDNPETATVTALPEIRRAIAELLENAIIHNDQETPQVSLVVEYRDETVRIEIVDNGPGIPEEEVTVLTREHEIEPLYHGSGMGLWLVNWIVKLSDGTVALEEREPRGSIVTIELNQPT